MDADQLAAIANPDALFRVVDVIGVIGNGLIGGVVARQYRFDLVGFVILAISSALGGGMIRDVLIGQDFPVALTDPWYLSGAVAAATIAYFIDLSGTFARRSILLADVLALGCWSATGASKALTAGLGWMPAIMLGVITATGGGMLRDIMVNRVPTIFGGNPLYATFAILGSVIMVISQENGAFELGMGLSITMATVLGLAARRRRWKLPEPVEVRIPAIPLRRPRWRRPARGTVAPTAPTASSADPPPSFPPDDDVPGSGPDGTITKGTE